jgi:hypothetical protein
MVSGLRVSSRYLLSVSGGRPGKTTSVGLPSFNGGQRDLPGICASVGLGQGDLLLPSGDADHHGVRWQAGAFDKEVRCV